MATGTTFVIDSATASDVPAATAVLADAFAHDPVMSEFVPAGAPDRRSRLRDLFAALVHTGPLRHGSLDVARSRETGKVLGVAAWEAPHDGPRPRWPQAVEAPRFARAFGWARLLTAARRERELGAERPDVPHWYLGQIGVGPDARGLGVGGALLAHRLERVDARREAAYLESSTERNRALYVRHGFVPGREIRGVGAARPVAMWREPQPPAG